MKIPKVHVYKYSAVYFWYKIFLSIAILSALNEMIITGIFFLLQKNYLQVKTGSKMEGRLDLVLRRSL